VSKIGNIIQKYNLHLCIGCGKCSSVCLLGEIIGYKRWKIFPRNIIEEIKVNPNNEEVISKLIWYCFRCNTCKKGCPQGVEFADFIREMREKFYYKVEKEIILTCKNCGEYLGGHIKWKEYLVKKIAQEIELLCRKCKKYNILTEIKKV
jgi:heterodisulfide reductase subunit C